jgi:hypothetical protein
METDGWTTAALAAGPGIVLALGYVLDQIPALSAKAEKAIVALRRLRAAWREGEKVTRQGGVKELDGPEDPGARS